MIVFVGNDAEVYDIYDKGLGVGAPTLAGEAVVTELYSSADVENLRVEDIFGARINENFSISRAGLSIGRGMTFSEFKQGEHNNKQGGIVIGRSSSLGLDIAPPVIGGGMDWGVSERSADSLMNRLKREAKERIDKYIKR